jgi:hypothetical protein
MIDKEKMYDYGLTQTMEWLMPWIDKTNQTEVVGDWEMNVPERMMRNLLNLFLTTRQRQKVEKVLQFYHPYDRAAIDYALLLNRLTGYLPKPRNLLVQYQLDLLVNVMKEDSNIKEIEHERKMEKIFRVEKSGELFSVGTKSTPKRMLVIEGLGGKRKARFVVNVLGTLAQVELQPGDVIAGKLMFDTFEYDGRTLQDITLIDFVKMPQ